MRTNFRVASTAGVLLMNAIHNSEFSGRCERTHSSFTRKNVSDQIKFEFKLEGQDRFTSARFRRLIKRTLDDLLVDLDVKRMSDGKYCIQVVAVYS